MQKLILDKNELWAFGCGISGQLGCGRPINKQNYPINLSKGSKKKFLDVSCGDNHVLGFGSKFNKTNKNDFLLYS